MNLRKDKVMQWSAMVFFALGVCLYVLDAFLWSHYGPMSAQQILFNIFAPSQGAPSVISWHTMRYALGGAVLCVIFGIAVFARRWRNGAVDGLLRAIRACGHFLDDRRGTAVLLIIAVLTMLWSLRVFLHHYSFRDYYAGEKERTELFDKECYFPSADSISLPFRKRNLVVVILESMETTYANEQLWGRDLIPELTALRRENLSFEGQRQVTGTEWTFAGTVSTLYGLPIVRIPENLSELPEGQSLLAHVKSLRHILQQKGYNQLLLRGASLKFSGMDRLFSTLPKESSLGCDELQDVPEYRKLPEEQRNPWGIHDELLFAIAKGQLKGLSAQKKPFCLVMSTVNTHGPAGWRLPGSKELSGGFYDVLSDQSRLVDSFVRYIRSQSYGKNTTIVLVGDHLAMDNPLRSVLGNIPLRSTYNCIINPVPKITKVNRQRLFATFDMAPTILEAMGAKWKNHRFGIGTSLFSHDSTLLERYGVEGFEEEIEKYSPSYMKLLLE